jgi:hypothetical protein
MTSGDPWTPPLEAFGRFTAQRKLAKRQLRELAAERLPAAAARAINKQA